MSMRVRATLFVVLMLCLALSTWHTTIEADTANKENKPDPDTRLAQDILKETGIQGGLIVHLGCGNGQLTAALRANDSYQVHGLDTKAENVQKARKYLVHRKLNGPVAVDQLHGKTLPYIDNLINLVVVEDSFDISTKEIERVLAPNGIAYVKKGDTWTKIQKPRSKALDEWTHYLHDSTGNAVAQDDVVGPPRHLQWLAGPRWSRHHDRMASMSALVSTKGRIFYIMDQGSRVSAQLPPKWEVVARDAFNGTKLWTKKINDWQNHLWPLKSGPTQLARRLVAINDKVYVPLGFEAPLTVLDAATGKTLKTYKQTRSTEEIVVRGDTIFVLVNKGESELAKYNPELNVGDQGRVARQFHWNGKPRVVMAIDAKSGKTLWRKVSVVAPLTLTVDDDQVVFHDGEKVVSLNRKDGKPMWNSEAVKIRPSVTFNFGPRLLIYKDVVLCAGGFASGGKKGKPTKVMEAFDAKTGKQLWTAPHARSGYQSPEDLMVAGGLVWVAPTTSGKDSGVFTGRDPHTGKVIKEFPPTVNTYWFHHRCYISKATENFLLTSRTGIEFVDIEKKDWEIHHWVRGGCLYGIMPCNGLVYTPPHNCACYPETKLFGLNALAPAMTTRKLPKEIDESTRLEKGPAYEDKLSIKDSKDTDWPTYRQNAKRSGRTTAKVAPNLAPSWNTKLGGKLSSVVIANGRLYVSQIDAHTVHALDATTGKQLWSFTAGGRVDAPPTIYQGRALFGSKDGYVYCLRADTGKLIWRYRAAPIDQRTMTFEQIESLWPVHGNILIQKDLAYFVAGRSNFLDGGLRLFRLDPKTGKKITEVVLDDKDPVTGKNLQERLQVLQMPTGLPDILSSDGEHVYMRSQRFDLEGKREEIGPVSGQAQLQGSAQRGEGVHLFASNGFLEDSWFHRSYWVYGKNVAGGHNGYYQAGKFAPAGRLLVFDDEEVYGFGRKPQYYKWTTTMEHQLFAASRKPPEIPPQQLKSGGGVSMIKFTKKAMIDPTNKPLTVEAWVKADKPGGVVLAHGGPLNGYALIIQQGKPKFVLRVSANIYEVTGKQRIVGKWTHLAGVLTESKELRLYVNGKQVATGKTKGLIPSNPQQLMQIGADDGGSVGDYRSPFGLSGSIDEVKVYHTALSADQIKARFEKPQAKLDDVKLIVSCSFDKGKAGNQANQQNSGTLAGAKPATGKLGGGMKFTGRKNNAGGGYHVKHRWTQDVPIYVNAMVMANDVIFAAGPRDIIDEEETFKRLRTRASEIQERLAKQDAILEGKEGATLMAITKDGKNLGQVKLPSLPVWDGMAVTEGQLFVATKDGSIICLEGKK